MNNASGSHLEVGHSRESCTAEIQLSEKFELDGRRVILIDTPGFDNTNQSDRKVWGSIAMFLEGL